MAEQKNLTSELRSVVGEDAFLFKIDFYSFR